MHRKKREEEKKNIKFNLEFSYCLFRFSIRSDFSIVATYYSGAFKKEPPKLFVCANIKKGNITEKLCIT